MPTGTIDEITALFQSRIVRNERRAASEMVRVYVEGWKRVRVKLERLQTEYDRTVERGETVDLSWIYQNSRFSDMQELIGKELSHFSQFAGNKISEEQARVIRESLEFSRDAMILQLGPEYDVPGILRVKSLPTKAIEAMVGVNQSGSPLRALFEGIKLTGAQKASDALIEGMMLGYNPRKIAPMIRDALGVQLSRALTISRTEIMRAQRMATEANYQANADIVKGWRWQAEVNGACPVCLAMHGTEHPLTEKMSSHPNCRCCQTPLTLSWEEIGEQFGMNFSGVEKAGPSFEEIAKKYKMTPEQIARYQTRNMIGEAYFETLSMEEQRKVLGPAKWLAWKDGKFAFGDIVKPTFNATWGEGKGVASLADLMGEKDANYYLRLVQNGLAKQNLNADELIKFASLDLRPLTNKEVGKIVDQVAERGFNNNLLEKAGGRLTGLEWQGNTIKGSDMMGSGIVHYLRHVVAHREWPVGTSVDDYYQSIKEVVLDKQSQLFVSRFRGALQVGIVRESGNFAGPGSKGLFFVEFRAETGHVVTANQFVLLDDIINSEKRSDLIWIRKK